MAGRARNLGQSTGRGQKQGQGQSRTNQIRDGQDALDEGFPDEPLCGAAPGFDNLGPEDEAVPIDDEEGLDEEDEAPDEPGPRRLVDMIGSRAPVVLLRLVYGAGGIKVRLTVMPRNADAAQALEELRFFVESRFHAGKELLTASEWNQLLGQESATIPERLLLLTRLAIEGHTKVVIENLEREDGSPCPRYQFTPNDRVLERYVGKFAALPDGTPFSLRLLLLDKRGKKKDDAAAWSILPWAIKLEALGRILAEEAAEGQACDDDAFRGKMQSKLKEMKVDVPKPTWDDVKNLRELLKRNGLGHVFPNARERQRSHDKSTVEEACNP